MRIDQLHRYLDQAGWLYIMPDFNVPNHSIIDWIGTGEPQEPAGEPSSANDNITDAESERLRGIADALYGEKA